MCFWLFFLKIYINLASLTSSTNNFLPSEWMIIGKWNHMFFTYDRTTNLNQWLLSPRSSWNSGPRNILACAASVIRAEFHWSILPWWHSSNNLIFIFKKFTWTIVKCTLTHHARMSVWISKTVFSRKLIEIIWASDEAGLSTSGRCSSE